MTKKDYMPLYKYIRAEILENIANHVYSPGDMIPSQAYYSKKFNVSRVTVREAINELVHRGVLYTRKGKGTFVKDYPIDFQNFHRLNGVTEQIELKKFKVSSNVLDIKLMKADNRIAEKLQMDLDGEVILIRRLRSVEGVPMYLENVYLNYERLDGIDFFHTDLENKSLYKMIKESTDYKFKYADEEIRAVACPADIAELFGIDLNEPVLFVKRVTYSDPNIPIEYCENYERSDLYCIKVRYFNNDH